MIAEHCGSKLHYLIVGDVVDVERVLRDDGVHGYAVFSLNHNHSAHTRCLWP